MAAHTTLAAGVMAALSVSALLAQSQTPSEPPSKLVYSYAGDPQHQVREASPLRENSVPATKPIPIPPVIHFCAQHCLTFIRVKDNELVNYTNFPGQHDEKRVFTIEKFTPESVVIHRTETGNFPSESIMTGRMQYGDSSAMGNGWAISWGKELDQLPPDDGGLAVARQQPREEQSMMLLFLLGAAMFGDSGSSPSKSSMPALGCAPGNMNCLRLNQMQH